MPTIVAEKSETRDVKKQESNHPRRAVLALVFFFISLAPGSPIAWRRHESQKIGRDVRANIPWWDCFVKVRKSAFIGLRKKTGQMVDKAAVEGDLKKAVIKDDDSADLDPNQASGKERRAASIKVSMFSGEDGVDYANKTRKAQILFISSTCGYQSQIPFTVEIEGSLADDHAA